MDKLHEDSRKQFEEWFEGWFGEDVGEHVAIGGLIHYVNDYTNSSWKCWQASRESIVVDTPPLCGDGENDAEYTEGYNDGITATEKTIRAIGLSIKGE